MEFRVLRYFLAVVREGSVTAGSRALHVTQPTLSRQLHDLEEELGRDLFRRNGTSFTLTPDGILFRQRAEEILSMVEKTEAEFGGSDNSLTGEVHIGGGETNAMRLVADAIQSVREKHPAVRFNIYSGNAEDVMDRLDKGLLDFGLLIHPVDVSKYEVATLPCRDVWGVIMRTDNPLARKKYITLNDIKKEPLICSRQAFQRFSGHNAYRDWFGNAFTELNIVATYNLIFNAALLVESGTGIAISLDQLIDTRSVNGLCFRPLKPLLESELCIVWKKNQIFSPAVHLFKQMLLEPKD